MLARNSLVSVIHAQKWVKGRLSRTINTYSMHLNQATEEARAEVTDSFYSS